MIKHIVFDCYGTLVDTGKGSIKAVEKILENVGSNVLAKEFYADWKRIKKRMINTEDFQTEKKFFEKSLGETFSKYGIVADAAVEVKPMIDSLFSERFIFDDVLNVLQKLSELEVDYAIGSTTDTDSIMYHLQLNKLQIKQIFTSEDMRVYKPKEKFYNTILHKNGWNAAECLFVGDNYEDDVCGPKSVGMKAVLLDRKCTFDKTLFSVQPNYVIPNLYELINILEVCND